jgi:hypothetical protein
MRSTRAAQAGIGALALLLIGVVGFRALRGGSSSTSSTSPGSQTPRPFSGAAPLNLSAPAGSLALSWVQLLRREPKTPAEEELLRSEERQLSDELKKRLAKDPSRWTDVLEVLSSEDPRLGRKIVAALPDAVGSGGEPVLVGILQSSGQREARKAAATLIGPRTTPDSLFALISAAQQDADSGVRHQALSELARRQGRAATPAEAATIDQTLRLRAQVDPDPELRAFALRATGQPVPPAKPGDVRTK